MKMNNSISCCVGIRRSAVTSGRSVVRSALTSLAALAILAAFGGGCSSSDKNKGGTGGSSSGGYLHSGSSGGVIVSGSSGGGVPGDDSGGSSSGASTPAVCDDSGLCTCADGGTTTITGHVYDPAGKNPLYNVSVFVEDPTSPLPDLDTAGLTCGCGALYPATVLATGEPTDATGFFQIPCAPSGTVTLVVQAGKWRMEYPNVAIQPDIVNQVPDMHLPGSSAEGSLPNIAISTGGADSLECLPLRIGVDPSEYVMGLATGGHIHIYTGYGGAITAQGSVES